MIKTLYTIALLALITGCAGNQYQINGGLCDYRDDMCSHVGGPGNNVDHSHNK